MSPLEIDRLLRAGFAQQQAGQPGQAESLYRQVLAQHPNHDGALNLLGGLAMHVSRPDIAVQFLRRACSVQPLIAGYHSNLGYALQCLGKADEAIASLRRVVALQPDNADAHSNLANTWMSIGKLDEAVAGYRRALELKPEFALAHNNLGIALKYQGNLDEAIASVRLAVALRPDYADAHNNLGLLLKDQEKLDEAIIYFRRASELKPEHAEIHNNLGLALKDREQSDEAVACLRKATQLNPSYAEAHNNLGLALVQQGKVDEAIHSFRRALELKPTYAEAHCSLGSALQDQKKIDEAIASFRRTLELKPDFVQAHCNLGNALQVQGMLDEAMASYRATLNLDPSHVDAHNNLASTLQAQGRYSEAEMHFSTAVRLNPKYSDAHWNRGLLRLLHGDFEHGWPEYEWRWKTRGLSVGHRPFTQPQWDEGSLKGRTILLHAEQGLGDTLQFIRYAPLVAEAGANIVVECPALLKRLLRSSLPHIPFIIKGEPLPAFDVHCPMLSLPLACRTTLANIPRQVPYLNADSDLAAHWQRKLAPQGELVKVGLVWAGNKGHKNDRNRSTELSTLAPLGAVPHVVFISLQKGEPAKQTTRAPAGMTLVDCSNELGDFADTAALIANLDLIISVDTAVAHLAGAMGKPVWTLLPFVPDWRWLLEREDSPWYPTMRLFRQSAPGDWSGVVTRVVDALLGFAR